MPSFLQASAFAASVFAVLAAAQNSTTPATVPGWVYLGCGASPSGFSQFTVVETSSLMSVERCISDCSGYALAGIRSNSCYCGNSQNDTSIVGDANCHIPCPGNPAEACGGTAGVAPAKRQLVGGPLLSLYEKLNIVPIGVIYTTVIINIYVDICPTGYTTVTYRSTATLTGCGCPTPVIPTIPVVTTTAYCAVCGPNGSPATVTVTVPAGVTPGNVVPTTTVTAKPALFTGGAANVAAGSVGGMLAFLGAGLALL